MTDHEILAIHEPSYRAMCATLELQQRRGLKLTPAEAAAHAGIVAGVSMPSRQATPGGGGGVIAVLPLVGFMSYRSGGLFSLLFGGASTSALAADVRRAAADATVSSIFIPTHSPGGEVAGTEELALAIAEAAKVKRVTAAVDVMAASAAYWAISGASEIIASPSALLGSLGIMAVHNSLAKALADAGIERTYITSSRFKAEGNEAEPLSPEARAELQSRVDGFDRMLTARVASGRRVSVDRVRAEFGQGRILMARDAVARGMADRIGTATVALEGLARPLEMQAAGSDLDTLRLRAQAAGVAVGARHRRLNRSGSQDVELLRLRHRAAELG